MLSNIGPAEIAIIAGVVALLFGAKRIPEVARGLGRSLNEFKRGLKEVTVGEEELAESIRKKTKDN